MHLLRSPIAWYTAIAVALMLATVAINAADWDDPLLTSASPANPAVRERIRSFEAGSTKFSVGIQRLERTDGQVFYLIESLCCDQFNTLYTADGRSICAPNGGFAGHGDGKCPAWVRGLRFTLPPALQAPAQPVVQLQGY